MMIGVFSGSELRAERSVVVVDVDAMLVGLLRGRGEIGMW